MLKRFIITFVALILISNLRAQADQEKITLIKVFGGYKYNVHGTNLKSIQLSEFVEKDEAANGFMKKAMINRAWSNILGKAGALLIFPLGTVVTGKSPSLGVVGLGAVLALTSIPFSLASNKQTKTAVDTYNSNVAALQKRKTSPALSLGIHKNGLGFRFMF